VVRAFAVVIVALPIATGAPQSSLGCCSDGSRTVSGDLLAVVLMTQRTIAADEALWLKVETGPLKEGVEIVLADETGRVFGGISPFGLAARNTRGSIELSLPASAIADGSVSVQIWIQTPNSAGRRPPTTSELLSVELIYKPVHGESNLGD